MSIFVSYSYCMRIGSTEHSGMDSTVLEINHRLESTEDFDKLNVEVVEHIKMYQKADAASASVLFYRVL